MASDKKWASIYLTDGSLIEGTVESEVAYGIYIHLNGVTANLRLLTWNTVEKVEYTNAN